MFHQILSHANVVSILYWPHLPSPVPERLPMLAKWLTVPQHNKTFDVQVNICFKLIDWIVAVNRSGSNWSQPKKLWFLFSVRDVLRYLEFSQIPHFFGFFRFRKCLFYSNFLCLKWKKCDYLVIIENGYYLTTASNASAVVVVYYFGKQPKNW